MNARAQPDNGHRETEFRMPLPPADSAAIQAVSQTMQEVAEASRRLKSVISAIEALVRSASGDSALTLTHGLILVNLSRAHTCKQSDLHSETGIAAGYLTRLIDELDAKGMVRRCRSTRDRRQILLTLTDDGRGAALSLLAAIDRQLQPNALDQLNSSLERFMAVCAPRE